MKRVLIFSTTYLPNIGGAEVAIAEITSRIPSISFDLICARFNTALPKEERIGAVTVYRVGVGIRSIDKILVPFLGAWKALLLEQEGRYDAYWAMMATYGSGGAYLANTVRLGRATPIILTLQEGDPPAYLRTKWFGLVGLSWRLALSQSAHVTVISSYLGALAKEFGYKRNPVYIPNGVDTKVFTMATTSQQEEPHPLGKKAGEVYLVTTSRLVKKNACDDVIRALAFLPPHISFTVYGDGPDESLLKKLAKHEKVEGRVRFMGSVPYKELPHLLHVHDIFVRPSRSEGMGNSFIEAMAVGLPVVATQEGGIADFLYDAKRNPEKSPTGWAVDANAPKQIAQAVRDILANKSETHTVTKAAQRLVQEKYDWSSIAKQMQSVFDQIALKR
jgi:glycosyltransferase involved in cell wall biosynthesis